MVFLLVACASLLAGATGVVLANRMPRLALTAATPVVSPSAIARVYGRRLPAQLSRPASPGATG